VLVGKIGRAAGAVGNKLGDAENDGNMNGLRRAVAIDEAHQSTHSASALVDVLMTRGSIEHVCDASTP
jgi:hypothetical protein